MKSKLMPDLSQRPFQLSLEHHFRASAADLYRAWTERFDLWFAQPGELLMSAEIDKPWFFYNRKDWGSHAHYGRFLELEKDRLVVTTWLTAHPGTAGAETVIRVELTPNEGGTLMRFTHSGFQDDAARQGHEDNWPAAFDGLEQALHADSR